MAAGAASSAWCALWMMLSKRNHIRFGITGGAPVRFLWGEMASALQDGLKTGVAFGLLYL